MAKKNRPQTKSRGKFDGKASSGGRHKEKNEKRGQTRPDERGRPRGGGGGLEFRDRSGKLHRIGGKPSQGHEQPSHEARRRPQEKTGKEFGHRKDERFHGKKAEKKGTHKRGGEIQLKATVDKNQKGFGFLIFEDRSYEDAFIPPREAESFFHGDRVEVTLNRRGEVEGVRVLEHRFRELVGRFEPHPNGLDRGGWVVYERKRAREEIYVPPACVKAKKSGAVPKAGDWVQASLSFDEKSPFPVTAQVVDVFGKQLPASADIGMVAAEYNLIEEHSASAKHEADQMTLEVPGRDLEGREDLRQVPFITIDSETARDFDDAVFVEREGSGYVLWVAIADVSHYVREGTHLDREAYSRATSVYFPERAFHMLPRNLSENLCSLRPKEPRLAMVARMRFDRSGKRHETEVMEAVIESHRRATYTEIQREWEENRKNPKWEFASHFALFQEIKKRRHARGSIDFDFPEAELKVTSDGEVESITQRPRNDAHRLIEEFMIAANEAVTEWMMERKWPFVYRVHDEPDIQKLEHFQELAASFGVKLSLERGVSPKVLGDLVTRLEGHPAQALLSMALLRSMKQAIYSSTHGIHFGLASEGYTHFTSPIRRYPDLIVHRLLRMALRVENGVERALKETERQRLEEALAESCEHCSYRERIASDAERESIKLKQVRAMVPEVGNEFEGKIVGMIEVGLFVRIEEPFVEGLLSRESMMDDFYQFNEKRMIFFGRRTRRTFKIGDPVRVRCLRADIDSRTIDFGLVEED